MTRMRPRRATLSPPLSVATMPAQGEERPAAADGAPNDRSDNVNVAARRRAAAVSFSKVIIPFKESFFAPLFYKSCKKSITHPV